ncbi:hypothetical protein MTR67_026488 [Solanum verrucosum]|uniref:Uncharacterized protein n=1 Tax=Solanum verrucosum TaxID=315347 RepID=A0AAF0R1S9_SOLVR|nr:hypothetical protein MTR67_026488 [Solanum verrucosum]
MQIYVIHEIIRIFKYNILSNWRVNALENVVKPRLENTVLYIKGELDKLEREDFFHLKKIQGYKKREVEKHMALPGYMQRRRLLKIFL